MESLYQNIANCHPALSRNKVFCRTCGNEKKVDTARCFQVGWPKCCNQTMTIDPPSMFENHMTKRQLEIVGHSLGINVYHAKRSKRKSDKRLPKDFYRNRFCAGESHDDYPVLKELERLGFMKIGSAINGGKDFLWYVTESGIRDFRSSFFSFIA